MSMFQEFLGDPRSSFKCACFLFFSFILHHLLIAACCKLRAGTKWKPNRLINSVCWSICSSGIVPASTGNSLICTGGLAYGRETPRQRSGSWGVEGLCRSIPNGSVEGGGLRGQGLHLGCWSLYWGVRRASVPRNCIWMSVSKGWCPGPPIMCLRAGFVAVMRVCSPLKQIRMQPTGTSGGSRN